MLILLFILGVFFGSLWLVVRLLRRSDRTRYYDGPANTAAEQPVITQAVIEVLQACPDSPIKEQFPYEHAVAVATTRYAELEALREQGLIDDIDYEREMEKILLLIKI
jgi:hypothetical protein